MGKKFKDKINNLILNLSSNYYYKIIKNFIFGLPGIILFVSTPTMLFGGVSIHDKLNIKMPFLVSPWIWTFFFILFFIALSFFVYEGKIVHNNRLRQKTEKNNLEEAFKKLKENSEEKKRYLEEKLMLFKTQSHEYSVINLNINEAMLLKQERYLKYLGKITSRSGSCSESDERSRFIREFFKKQFPDLQVADCNLLVNELLKILDSEKNKLIDNTVKIFDGMANPHWQSKKLLEALCKVFIALAADESGINNLSLTAFIFFVTNNNENNYSIELWHHTPYDTIAASDIYGNPHGSLSVNAVRASETIIIENIEEEKKKSLLERRIAQNCRMETGSALAYPLTTTDLGGGKACTCMVIQLVSDKYIFKERNKKSLERIIRNFSNRFFIEYALVRFKKEVILKQKTEV